MQHDFHNSISRQSIEDLIADTIAEEIKKDESPDLFEKLRDQIYNRTPQSLRIAEAMITEIQYRFEKIGSRNHERSDACAI